MNHHVYPAPPRRGRRGTTLAVLVGLIAPASALVAATPASAAPDQGGSPSGASMSGASVRALQSATAEDGTDSAGFILGYSGECSPQLAVTTTDGSTTLTATDQGWYDASGLHGPSNPNYFVGASYYRNFFVFDTASLTGEITSASLEAVQAGCSEGDGPTSTYWLNDVTTPVEQLVQGSDPGEAGQAVYRDLRAGESYGRTVVTDPNADVSVPLSSAGVAALAGADGLFAVGGAYYDKVATTTLTADPAAGDNESGGDVTLTATVDGESGSGAPTGTVDFTEAGVEVAGCTDVALVPAETGEDSATATCVVPQVHPGVYTFAATYSGDQTYSAGNAGELAYDSRATPEVSAGLVDETEGVIRTEEVTLTTEVTGLEGEAVPTGTVDFLDDDAVVEGCQDVALTVAEGATSATASCQTSFDTTGEHAVTVDYPGDGTYVAQQGGPLAVQVLSDAPTITAEVTSEDEPNAARWFQAPATVTFTCESFHGVDESGCPEPVTVTRNGRADVSGTVTDTEGQQASTTVVVKVDKRAPRIVVRNVRDGATYDRVRAVRCSAFDRHSRLAGDCSTETAVVKRFRDGRREIAYVATAMDRADNVSQKSGSYFVR